LRPEVIPFPLREAKILVGLVSQNRSVSKSSVRSPDIFPPLGRTAPCRRPQTSLQPEASGAATNDHPPELHGCPQAFFPKIYVITLVLFCGAPPSLVPLMFLPLARSFHVFCQICGHDVQLFTDGIHRDQRILCLFRPVRLPPFSFFIPPKDLIPGFRLISGWDQFLRLSRWRSTRFPLSFFFALSKHHGRVFYPTRVDFRVESSLLVGQAAAVLAAFSHFIVDPLPSPLKLPAK